GTEHRVLLRVAPGASPAALAAAYPGLRVGALSGGALAAHAPDAVLDALAADARVLEVAAAARLRPLLDVSRSSTVVSSRYAGTLRNGLSDLAALDGTGVVVGVVDTGIDWQHRDFSVDGSPDTTRILAIWDQTISSHAGGAFPSGFTYGAEYTKASIDAKLAGGANTINTSDVNGHGTHVASIAAGDGTATDGDIPSGTFKGFAPAADLVIVKTSFLDADIVDGINYVVAKAQAAGKRAVINLSLGGQAGPHDGTSTFETGVSAVAASTPVFVSVGNDGATAPHARATFAGLGTSNFTASVTAPPPTTGELEFWHPSGDAYTATVTLFGESGTVSATSGNTASGAIAGHTIQVFNATNTGHPSGDKQIYVSVTRSGGLTVSQITVALTRTAAGGGGRVDGFVDPGGQGLDWMTFVDSTLTMASPATADDVFSIGALSSKTTWLATDGFNYSYGTQSAVGTASHFSSRGPTRDGRQAPELVAPGDVVAGALSTGAGVFAANCDPGNGCLVLEDDRHTILRGTSMSAPAAAGVAALRLQAQPGLTVAGLRAVLRALALTDSATGTVPNDSTGYGKLAASPQPVSPPSGFAVTVHGTSSITWTWGEVTAASSYRVYNATNTSSLIAAPTSPSLLMTGLTSNTTYGLFIRGVAGGVDGPGTFISTATYSAPVAPGVATGFVSSVTLSFTPCPAAPASASCSGYVLTGSTDAAFGGVSFASATANRASTSLTLTGLSALTTYYLRLATLNQFGGASVVSAGSTRTITDLLAPITPIVSEVSSVTARFNWAVGANPQGLTYLAEVSSAPDFGGTVFSSSTRNLSALFSALSVNTSYYFRVQAVSGPHLTHGPVPTHAVPATAPAAPFAAVSSTTVTVSWSPGLDPAGTLFVADLSAAADFSAGVFSSATRATDASFAGLTANTTYYARVTAVSHGGTSAGAVSLGSSATLAAPVVPLAAPFSAQSSTGFAFAFGAGGNPAGTRFVVRVSTDPAFSVLHGSSVTLNAFASFSGLLSNQLYWAQAAAVNLSGAVAPFSTPQSTATTVAAPGAAAVPVSSRTVAGLTAAWSTAGFGAGTEYLAEASLTPGFAAVAASSQTRNAEAALTGLTANTSYYLRVRALSQNAPNPNGAHAALGAAYTLAPAPTPGTPPFAGVGASSLTVRWSGGAFAYRVELAPDPAYAAALTSAVAVGASSASYAGLLFATTYYARAGALNGDGVPNWGYLGSTTTLRPLFSSATAAGGAVALSLPAAFAAFPGAALTAEPGTFPGGTPVTIVAGTSLDLTAARGAVPMTALGAGVAYDISASGLQPLKPVRLLLTYDPASIPAGQDARRLRLARYDEGSGLWQLMPSAVDPAARTLAASLDHFSVFAPFFVTAGAGPDSVLIYPNPWEIGAGNDYAAAAMTFASVPDGASVRVLTMAGELVWEATAGPSGVVTWDGRNRFGVKAGPATYFVVIKSGGRAVTRRAVLVR
ncbi:MAG: S8 family serine peptidase, partial [Elusimicrobiota bacterium]|nr:S8 family serine peptidase [Elusimicrobiota bacterium]